MAVDMQDAFPLRLAVDQWRSAQQSREHYGDWEHLQRALKVGDELAFEAVKLIAVWIDMLQLVDAAQREKGTA